MKTFQTDLVGNNSRQFNQRVIYQKFLQQIGKGKNASELENKNSQPIKV